MKQQNIFSVVVYYVISILFIILFLIIQTCISFSQEISMKEIDILPFKNITACLKNMTYLESAPFTMSLKSNFVNSDECNFIGENISSVRVQPYSNKTYISFCVCGDTTTSVYYVVKTNNEEYYEILHKFTNIAGTKINVPLLYSCIDTVELTEHTYYKFFKMHPNGRLVLVVTVSVPMDLKNNDSTLLNIRRKQFYGNK